MIYDKVDWAEWIDLRWVASKSLHSISHGSEVDDSWHSCEILQDNSSWFKWNINTILLKLNPIKDPFDIRRLDIVLIAVSYGGLEENTDRIWNGLKSLISNRR